MQILGELLKPLELLLNRGFQASSKAKKIGQTHDGKVLAIYGSNPAFQLFIRVNQLGLEFLSEYSEEPDATIGGRLVSLSKLVGPNPEKTIRQEGILIDGDAGFAQDMQSLFAEVRPDPEEELSRFVGDTAAHQIGRTMSDAVSWGRSAVDTLFQNFSEFVSEESRDVPTQYEAREFMDEIDRLRDDVDRLGARLDRLKTTE